MTAKMPISVKTKDCTSSRATALPLLPHLFSRLTDNAPHETSEAPSAYTLTATGLHDEIRRDLGYLLNASSLGDLIDPLAYPLAAGSCLNYGMPPLAGGSLGPAQSDHLAALINQAVGRYEPRLVAGTVSLHWPTEPATAGRRGPGASRARANAEPAADSLLRFEIHASLQPQIYPSEFIVQSAVDLASQRLTVLGPA